MNIFQFTVWLAGTTLALFFSISFITLLHDLFTKENNNDD